MTRVVSLCLPNWPIDRLRKAMGDAAPPPEAPLALRGFDGRRRIVTAAAPSALAAGVTIGMPLAKAQALVEGLIVMDSDRTADAAGLEQMARWALRRYAPVAAADPPDGLVLETSGADHLKGGEAAMLADMLAQLAVMGITAWGAMADSWGAAHAVARFSGRRATVVPPGQAASVLPDLSMAALRLPAGMVRSLYLLGFETIGQVAAQPRAPLTLRFGPELFRRIDQVFGRAPEPIEPVVLPHVTEVARVFAEPIGAPETIARYILKLTTRLCDLLDVKRLGAKRLDLMFRRVDNRMEVICVRLGQPVRDVKRLNRLLCDKIETVDPGFGIEVMTLRATITEPLFDRQTDSEAQAQPDITQLIDLLGNRPGRIYRWSSLESDVPERSVTRISPQPAPAMTWPRHWPRPVRLLASPETITTIAQLPDHPPIQFHWRGQRHRVVHADGPERIFGEWWRRNREVDAMRDYFRVEDEHGQRFWIFRSGRHEDRDTDDAWYLHGFFA